MKIAIVEDELLASTYLKTLLEKQTVISVNEISTLRSVQQSVAFFKENKVDLIFMDIHLGDGKSLEIFKEVEIFTPIIFITAYDSYAIQVFKQFTIDYILKPFEEEEFIQALHKYNQIRESYDITPTLQSLATVENNQPATLKNRFLVYNGHKLRSIEQHEVAYFLASGKHLFLHTTDGNSFIYDDTIKDIIHKLDGKIFFKINRKFVVHINAIAEIIKHSSQRIEIVLAPHPEGESPILISKAQLAGWKLWLNT